MRKVILALLLTLGVVSLAMAQASPTTAGDAQFTNLQPSSLNEPTHGNSQYIHIKVTMAGVVFQMTNGDWVIGNNTGTPATSWFAFPANYYMSAGGLASGVYPAAFINPATAPYDTIFTNDCPVIYNMGGVSLDFFLTVENLEGWWYESAHSSNIMTAAHAVDTRVASGEPFKNAFQVRAIFCRQGDGANTANYNDAHPDAFLFPTGFDAPATTPPYVFTAPAPAWMNDVDLVFTSAGFGDLSAAPIAGIEAVEAFGWASAGVPPWLEATTKRFNPPAANVNDVVRSATEQGIGLSPNTRLTIALELLTPRTITSAYRSFLMQPQVISLRLFGVPSDAI